jgi:hypothetical protein
MAWVRVLSIFCCPRFFARAEARDRLMDLILAWLECEVRVVEEAFAVLLWAKHPTATITRPQIATNTLFPIKGRRKI